MRILKIVSGLIAVGLVVSGVAYLLRTDPIGPIAGKRLSGTEVTERVTDWSFTDEHMTIAIETRPGDPHSVTVICFTHRGKLYVPARDGAEKDWPQYVLADPAVRLKIGDKVYRGKAKRITDERLRSRMFESAAKKYTQLGDAGDGEPPDTSNVWLFRIDPS